MFAFSEQFHNQAVLVINQTDAVFKGITIGKHCGECFAFAADFRVGRTLQLLRAYMLCTGWCG